MKPVIAIIPARGGSKGIPRKNVRPLLGKPLLAYSLEHARQTPYIERILVSTDDAEVAAVAEANGAEVVARPAEISGDTASSESALVHTLDVLHQRDRCEPALVVFLQATSPLRGPNAISAAIETMIQDQADSLFSAGPLHAPIWRVTPDGPVSFNFDYRNRRRRQDVPEELVENGSIYVFKPWVLREYGNRLGGKIAVYRMSAQDSLQVDTLDDLALIEQIMLAQGNSRRFASLADVQLLALDFAGVMTDNRVLISQNGSEAVWYHRGDELGLVQLQMAGISVAVISSETNEVAAARCNKLGLECIQGCADKAATLAAIASQKGLTAAQVSYMGNDANDVDCMAWAGVPIAVMDAEPIARRSARLITSRCGGFGAVREVCEWILASRIGEAKHG